MINDLKIIENFLFEVSGVKMSRIALDQEAQDYFGYNFQFKKLLFKFRKAKITPKKVGQFVTLWKRNAQNNTEPFSEMDNFDFYIIATAEDEKFGLFIFPKSELISRNILSTRLKQGKRGFRVYPSWVKTENKQADKTQIWQTKFFIDFTKNNAENLERLRAMVFA